MFFVNYSFNEAFYKEYTIGGMDEEEDGEGEKGNENTLSVAERLYDEKKS